MKCQGREKTGGGISCRPSIPWSLILGIEPPHCGRSFQDGCPALHGAGGSKPSAPRTLNSPQGGPGGARLPGHSEHPLWARAPSVFPLVLASASRPADLTRPQASQWAGRVLGRAAWGHAQSRASPSVQMAPPHRSWLCDCPSPTVSEQRFLHV